MATITRPTPLLPRKIFRARSAAPARTPAAGTPAPAPSAYTRSALPLALIWFALPATLLVLSLAFGWSY
ncbi:MAG: hypothetical protein ABR506_01505 [Candidatus Krumholzibacteriia bacterium]